jgi:hypothetical protein
MNATALFPSTVLEGNYNYNVTVFFTVMLPANASYYYGWMAGWYLYSGPIVNGTPTGRVGPSGSYPVEVLVKGEPMGEAGIGFWNLTISAVPPPVPFSGGGGPVSWLSFTVQTEAYLSIFLWGWGNVTASNGTVYAYSLSTLFNFQNSTITFYEFGYPVVAVLGYVGSFVIVVFSLAYLINSRKSRQVKKEIREAAPTEP